MIMPDYAISKQHAAIEIKRGNYILRDCGSTNGTMLNSRRLDKKPVELRDKDIVAFARYEFSFLFPGSLYDMLRGE
jgi:pSer/pThr/pTyr-binding forkhead associated (FHA) protein